MSCIDALVTKTILLFMMLMLTLVLSMVFVYTWKTFTYKHNDLESMEKNLQRATKWQQKQVEVFFYYRRCFGMRGQGKLTEIVAMKQKYNFRLLVDDAHGFGTLGKTGAGGEKSKVVKMILMYTSLHLLNQ
jgi:glycine C-acetyltransferase